MSELYQKIKDSQAGCVKNMEELCRQFQPIIRKYSKMFNYEDSYNEMLLSFIEIIHKMPMKSENFMLDDMYILSYIKISMRNRYVALNRKKEKLAKIILYDACSPIYGKLVNKMQADIITKQTFIIDLKEMLAQDEYNLIIFRYAYEYTESELSEIFDISRQAINKKCKRTLAKVKKLW